jgi:hypothetical protein
MLKLRLRLDDDVFDWLHAEAARLNVNVSTVVRRVLRGERRKVGKRRGQKPARRGGT